MASILQLTGSEIERTGRRDYSTLRSEAPASAFLQKTDTGNWVADGKLYQLQAQKYQVRLDASDKAVFPPAKDTYTVPGAPQHAVSGPNAGRRLQQATAHLPRSTAHHHKAQHTTGEVLSARHGGTPEPPKRSKHEEDLLAKLETAVYRLSTYAQRKHAKRHGGRHGDWGFAAPTLSSPAAAMSIAAPPEARPISAARRPVTTGAGGSASLYSQLAHTGVVPMPRPAVSDWLYSRMLAGRPATTEGVQAMAGEPLPAVALREDTRSEAHERLFSGRLARDLRNAADRSRPNTAPAFSEFALSDKGVPHFAMSEELKRRCSRGGPRAYRVMPSSDSGNRQAHNTEKSTTGRPAYPVTSTSMSRHRHNFSRFPQTLENGWPGNLSRASSSSRPPKKASHKANNASVDRTLDFSRLQPAYHKQVTFSRNGTTTRRHGRQSETSLAGDASVIAATQRAEVRTGATSGREGSDHPGTQHTAQRGHKKAKKQAPHSSKHMSEPKRDSAISWQPGSRQGPDSEVSARSTASRHAAELHQVESSKHPDRQPHSRSVVSCASSVSVSVESLDSEPSPGLLAVAQHGTGTNRDQDDAAARERARALLDLSNDVLIDDDDDSASTLSFGGPGHAQRANNAGDLSPATSGDDQF